MKNPTPCLDGLPEELLDEILFYVGLLPDRWYGIDTYSIQPVSDLLRVSKKFRRLAETRRYFGYVYTQYDYPSKLRGFLMTLIQRPDLALHMRNVQLELGRDEIPLRGEKKKVRLYKPPAGITNVFCAAARKLDLDISDHFFKQLREGREEAEVALLVHTLPNLKNLRILTQAQKPDLHNWLRARPRRKETITHTSTLAAPQPLSQLNRFSIRQNSLTSTFACRLLMDFLAFVPSLRTITFDAAWPFPKLLWSVCDRSAAVTHATLFSNSVPAVTVLHFCKACTALKSLYVVRRDPDRGLSALEADMATLREALALHAASLEVLRLDVLCNVARIEEGRRPVSAIGDLRMLDFLRELEVSAQLLAGWLAGPEPTPSALVDLLPKGLERLRFTSDVKGDETFEGFLERLAECVGERFPRLRRVELLPWRVKFLCISREVVAKLRPRFKRWGVELVEPVGDEIWKLAGHKHVCDLP
ncbi:uncharacterized protein K452DRAFT_293240 [Aplosporella prunicola CBS 121167]|uniref:Leucine-rich repeat domain-containing protein n=1 Tax=Aplosporella prunicola CBS 121167 TaxID=1176127 RepID=A0A6A6AWV3_9PEZI|nr:uncharacterized protein K452DRAFT_293240 [Aplosporella prunicola CBS 121167]KAF2135414.1 hypothetical protein K452DRAFT_293240 [Aplosporella prunicola CBS 121167]